MLIDSKSWRNQSSNLLSAIFFLFLCFFWTHYLFKMPDLLTQYAKHDKAFFPGKRFLQLLDFSVFYHSACQEFVLVRTHVHKCESKFW